MHTTHQVVFSTLIVLTSILSFSCCRLPPLIGIELKPYWVSNLVIEVDLEDADQKQKLEEALVDELHKRYPSTSYIPSSRPLSEEGAVDFYHKAGIKGYLYIGMIESLVVENAWDLNPGYVTDVTITQLGAQLFYFPSNEYIYFGEFDGSIDLGTCHSNIASRILRDLGRYGFID